MTRGAVYGSLEPSAHMFSQEGTLRCFASSDSWQYYAKEFRLIASGNFW